MVVFPAASFDEQPSRAESPEPERVPCSKTRVLIVEDEPGILELCRIGLPDFGFRCDIARTVEEAIRKRNIPGNEYDVVVSDVILSDGSGTELLRASNGRRQPPFAYRTRNRNRSVCDETHSGDRR